MEILCCIPFTIGLPLLGVIAFGQGIRKNELDGGGWFLIALIAYVLTGFVLRASDGDSIPLTDFTNPNALLAIIIVFSSGAGMVVLTPKRRRLFAAIVGVGLPLIVFVVIYFNPRQVRLLEDMRLVANAIEAYQADHGEYPETLEELVPNYIDDLREPPTFWEWFYRRGENSYRFAYVASADRWGYRACIYNSLTRDWDCGYVPFMTFDDPPTLAPNFEYWQTRTPGITLTPP